MIRVVSIALLTLAGLTMAGCVQDSAQATNKGMSKSQVYIGALTCNIAGGMGYLIAGSRTARCLFTPEIGQPQAYTATIRDLGIDIGETAAITAGSTTGGNWLYGGRDGAAVLQATAAFIGDNAGYDLQYGAITMTLSLAP